MKFTFYKQPLMFPYIKSKICCFYNKNGRKKKQEKSSRSPSFPLASSLALHQHPTPPPAIRSLTRSSG